MFEFRIAHRSLTQDKGRDLMDFGNDERLTILKAFRKENC